VFTGIIECIGEIIAIVQDSGNIHYTVKSPFTAQLKLDQSIAHDGVCLTVTGLVEDKNYTVTAIAETLSKTTLSQWAINKKINLERSMLMNGRLDGHIVQGHVDTIIPCIAIVEERGSWRYRFAIDKKYTGLIIDKGSVCINGVSLTICNPSLETFEVCVIPYTYENTNFHQLRESQYVNIEFDILGKYIQRNISLNNLR